MKKTIGECSKCKQPTAQVNVCDNCGEAINPFKIFFEYVTVRRAGPEGGDQWDFEFCKFKCLVEWMNKRAVTDVKQPSLSPYDWLQEKKVAKREGEKLK